MHDILSTTDSAQYKTVVIKIGTNAITDEHGFLHQSVLKSLVDQVCRLKNLGISVIIVSSGSMTAGRSLLSVSPKNDGVLQRQVFSAVGQVLLMNTYLEAFHANNFLCAQVLTTKEDFRSRKHYLNMKSCFSALLRDNIVPIVNENDAVSVEELMFTDNDELAGLVASMVDASAVFILTCVDGVYNGSSEDGEVISDIYSGSTFWKECVHSNASQFGRGGMHTKCSIAQKLAATGIAVHVVNARENNVILEIVQGKHIGTTFHPGKRMSNTKRWIAHSEGTETGKVIVNACAIDALTSSKPASLLPVGILEVCGDFKAGDIVEICGEDWEKIGLGKAQYSAAAARSAMGKKSKKPFIHYDYLYIL